MTTITITIPQEMTVSQMQNAVRSFGVFSTITMSFPPSMEAPKSLMVEEVSNKTSPGTETSVGIVASESSEPAVAQTVACPMIGEPCSPVFIGHQPEVEPVCAPLLDRWMQDESAYGVCPMEIETWEDECDVQTDEE